uniref:NADH dehydrogenase [ubiquinone] 1 beta subcomplex subunit 7 n=1 Tax=Denticeps clupeoides TaxID=299321 RepID=A0AAY4AAE8_9TELE
MGAHLVRSYVTQSDTTPDPAEPFQFDPMLGFEERKEREMVATQEQMNLAMLPLEQRDYCAHHLMKFLKCKRDNWPKLPGLQARATRLGLLRAPGLRDEDEGVREGEEAAAEAEEAGSAGGLRKPPPPPPPPVCTYIPTYVPALLNKT